VEKLVGGGLWPPLPSELKRLLTNLRNLMNTHNTTDPPVAPGFQRIPLKPDSDKNRDSDDDELDNEDS
jgi:hypothetical protein